MDVNIYHASATLSYYPSASGFFVKGGAGAAILDADVKSGSASLTLDLGTGFNVIAGAGYDVPLSRRVSFTPALDYWYGTLGDVRVVGVTNPLFENWKQNVVTATVGITFH